MANKPILYIVATPIGNLADISLRALDALKNADAILAEDTRVSAKLLARYGIKKPVFSLRERSGENVTKGLVDNFLAGKWHSACYLTDAGTPGVSDPGGRLVCLAREADVQVTPLPGPSALTAIMQVAGVDLSSGVLFLGFLPKKKGRHTLFLKLKDTLWPVVIFEDKHRLAKTLSDFKAIWPSAYVVVGRELTKKFEEIKAGSVEEIIGWAEKGSLRGEFTLLVRR
jgi:16S rRNA (cytidine1402-2'-O)-methyltransferase